MKKEDEAFLFILAAIEVKELNINSVEEERIEENEVYEVYVNKIEHLHIEV